MSSIPVFGFRHQIRFFCIFSFTLLLFTAQAFAENREHTVQSGETAYTLARRYGVRPEEILFINGIEDARKIKVGQKLRIPENNTMAAPASIGGGEPAPVIVDYTAVNGDTLYGIARKYGITYQALVDANNFSKDKKLKIGEKVKVPVPASAQPEPVPGNVSAPPVLAVAAGESVLPVDKMAAPIGKSSPARAPLPPAPPAKNISAAKTSTPAKPAGRQVDLKLKWPVRIKDAAYMTGKLDGVVLTGEKAAPVQSLSAGTVASAGPYRGFGRVAIVQSDSGYIYVYGGCETLSVRAGERIAAGSEIGRLGVDAVSQKPQLFFMVYNGTKAIDPAKAPRV